MAEDSEGGGMMGIMSVAPSVTTTLTLTSFATVIVIRFAMGGVSEISEPMPDLLIIVFLADEKRQMGEISRKFKVGAMKGDGQRREGVSPNRKSLSYPNLPYSVRGDVRITKPCRPLWVTVKKDGPFCS